MNADLTPTEVDTIVPLHGEELSVVRRAKVSGRVRVNIRTVERDETVESMLAGEHVEIERLAIGRQVESAPPVRQEGDTTVVSVVEEVIVTERRLILKEEIRLRRVQTTTSHRETHTIREQHADIERVGPDT